jgi:hypothetical protein
MCGAIERRQPRGDVFTQSQVAVVGAVPKRGESNIVIGEDSMGSFVEQACGEQSLVWPSGGGAVSRGGRCRRATCCAGRGWIMDDG